MCTVTVKESHASLCDMPSCDARTKNKAKAVLPPRQEVPLLQLPGTKQAPRQDSPALNLLTAPYWHTILCKLWGDILKCPPVKPFCRVCPSLPHRDQSCRGRPCLCPPARNSTTCTQVSFVEIPEVVSTNRGLVLRRTECRAEQGERKLMEDPAVEVS